MVQSGRCCGAAAVPRRSATQPLRRAFRLDSARAVVLAVGLLTQVILAVPSAANTTYCWGSGTSGQLGNGYGDSFYAWPLPVAVLDAPDFAAVVAGEVPWPGWQRRNEAPGAITCGARLPASWLAGCPLCRTRLPPAARRLGALMRPYSGGRGILLGLRL